MYIDFNSLPDSARVWIYQSNRELTSAEVLEIKSMGKNFVNEWTAHQYTLHSSFEVLHNYFLVIAVDENVNIASGCSIDKSVHFIKEVEKKYKLKLFDRLAVGFYWKSKVQVVSLNSFLNFFKENQNSTIEIFNNFIETKKELAENWKVLVKDSWVANRVQEKGN